MRTGNAAKVKNATLPVGDHFFEFNVHDDGNSSVHFVWGAGVGTITFEGSNFDRAEVAYDAVSTKWQSIPLPSVPISGSGGALVSWGNGSVLRIRAKVNVTTQVTGFELRSWGVE